MKVLIALLISLTFISVVHAATEDPRLPVQRLKVLHSRLHEVLSYRNTAMASCALRRHDLAADALASRIKLNITKVDSSREMVLELLDEYRDTLKFREACAKELEVADQKLFDRERKIFQIPEVLLLTACGPSTLSYSQCQIHISAIWAEMDPHCFSVYDADFTGARESNACFAAEPLLAQQIIKSDFDQSAISQFLYYFSEQVDSSANGVTLDWLGIQPKMSSVKSKRDFFNVLATFYTAGNSVLGYMDDFVDLIWREALTRGESAEQALYKYDNFKKKMDVFFNILKRTREKNMKLTFDGKEVTRANHHTYISAFISCHYQSEGKIFAESLPYLLGAAYETKDFAANEKDGMPLSSAIHKFEMDMNRYVQGARLGYSFCRDLRSTDTF